MNINDISTLNTHEIFEFQEAQTAIASMTSKKNSLAEVLKVKSRLQGKFSDPTHAAWINHQLSKLEVLALIEIPK